MKRIQHFYLYIVILIFLLVGCSKPVNITNSDTQEVSRKIIYELKSENSRLINENNQLSQEVNNQKKLLDLRNFLDMKFYYLLYDMRHTKIDEIKKEVTPNIAVDKDKLISQSLNGPLIFKFPKDNVQFRERWFAMENPKTYKAVYEVWDPEEEKLLECYVEYTLEDTIWKFNSIFIDGAN